MKSTFGPGGAAFIAKTTTYAWGGFGIAALFGLYLFTIQKKKAVTDKQEQK